MKKTLLCTVVVAIDQEEHETNEETVQRLERIMKDNGCIEIVSVKEKK